MLKTISKDKTILSKVIFTVLILILSQLITNIPVPGINRTLIDLFLNSEIGESMSFISLFSGNSLNNMSMFILGISPYITASIVLQLLRVAFPKLDEMAKDGKMGETRYKRLSYFTGGLFAVMQAFPIAYGVLGQETTGAAGFSFAMRSVYALKEYCELIKKYAKKDCKVFNFRRYYLYASWRSNR